MNVASLVSSEWSDHPRSNSSYSSQPSPAASVSGSVRKFDEYQEKPSPISTSAASYFPAVNSKNSDNARRISTQLPLSPPADDQRKFSLPSISSLLEGVDCMPASKRQRHNSNEYSRIFLPPTPPMRPASGFTERSSPSGRSHSASISSAVSHTQTSLPPIAASLATSAPSSSSSSSERALSISISSLASHDMPSPSPTTTSTAATSTKTYYTSSSADESYSRTTQNTSTPATPVALPPAMVSPVNPGWQHHHYFPISTAAASYPQNHERYVCRTCHKAFSRPSSLRIHSHSHTGEKPFRCTHTGCGKAFSVRSNMKRHERGCHSGRPLAATALV